MKTSLVFCLVVLSCNADSLPEGVQVLSDGSLLVDDMMMTPDEYLELNPEKREMVKRHGVVESRRWPNPGRIPYEFAPKLAGSKSAVLAAFKEYEKHTCLRFVPRTSTDVSYIYITQNDYPACTANTGYYKTIKTQIFLNRGCFGRKTILHEIGHALGRNHEHNHPGMESTATILWDNIDPAQKARLKSNKSSWPIKYDPESIMHYGNFAFVKKGCKNPDGSRCKSFTMKNGPDRFGVGGKDGGMTEGDIRNMNYMYKCPGSL